MIETCFEQFEYYLKQVKNAAEDYVFLQARRLVREKPDYDFITASVTEHNPYCLVVINDYQEKSLGYLFNTYTEYAITDIDHEGTGTATYEITGYHEGNNSYVLKISQGGIVGTEPYPQYQIKINDGAFGDPTDVPADGEISLPDNTTFAFEVGGLLVADDTYSWQTIAKRINVFKEKEITVKLRADIWAKTKKELFETDGYVHQVSQLLIERYVTDGTQVITQRPGPSRWVQSEFEKEHQLVRGALEVTYVGAQYRLVEDALVCKFVMES